MNIELTKLIRQSTNRDTFSVEFTVNGVVATLNRVYPTLDEVCDIFKMTKSEVEEKIYKFSWE